MVTSHVTFDMACDRILQMVPEKTSTRRRVSLRVVWNGAKGQRDGGEGWGGRWAGEGEEKDRARRGTEERESGQRKRAQ